MIERQEEKEHDWKEEREKIIDQMVNRSPCKGYQEQLRIRLRDVIGERVEKRDEVCILCGQVAKVYKPWFGFPLCKAISYIVHHYLKSGEWIDVVNERDLMKSRTWNRCSYWGLAYRKPPTTEKEIHVGSSGLWKPTEEGIKFANRQLRIHEYCFCYTGEALLLVGEKKGIDELWKEEGMNWERMMTGQKKRVRLDGGRRERL
jgi:hypothetical protein